MDISIPADTWHHILSYSILPKNARVCKYFSSVEKNLLHDRIRIVKDTYGSMIDTAIDKSDWDVVIFMFKYWRTFNISLIDKCIYMCTQNGRPDIIPELIRVYDLQCKEWARKPRDSTTPAKLL